MEEKYPKDVATFLFRYIRISNSDSTQHIQKAEHGFHWKNTSRRKYVKSCFFFLFFFTHLQNKLQVSYVEKFFLKLIKSVTFHNGWFEESPQVQHSVVHSLASQGL